MADISVFLWDSDYEYFSSRQTLQCFQFCHGTMNMIFSSRQMWQCVSILSWEGDFDYFSSRLTLLCFQFRYGKVMTIFLLGRRCRYFSFVVRR